MSGQKTGSKNFSSIPSKFETTLFTGNKEVDGFGSRAHRFVENEVPPCAHERRTGPLTQSYCAVSQNDLPGPGSYEEVSKVKDDKVYSKKGLGNGFVSKTKRESAFGASSSAPGIVVHPCDAAVCTSERAAASGATQSARSSWVSRSRLPSWRERVHALAV